MSPIRPDLVECWVFRVPDPPGGPGAEVPRPEPEFLLIRRAPGHIFPGLWQCVTGGPDPAERIPQAALREVAEETGFGTAD
ncbi:MAG TPA: NUDIX domain-containing protein, partial [Candidatus Saccharimonadia bacterium]|nr:NUDIX domain-containing protein [Candidatus Saccharimonadia bacterium]